MSNFKLNPSLQIISPRSAYESWKNNSASRTHCAKFLIENLRNFVLIFNNILPSK